MTWLARCNLLGAVAAPLLFMLLQRAHLPLTHILLAASLLLIVLVLPAANVTAMAVQLLRVRLTLSEYASLVSALALFLTPSILSLLPKSYLTQYNIFIIAAFYISAVLYVIVTKLSRTPTVLPKLHITIDLFKSPLIWAVAAYLIVISIIVFTYPILPDQDPYTWLDRYRAFFNDPQNGILQRPIFYYFLHASSIAAQTSIYNVLKYIMPYLVVFALPLLWLPASLLRGRLAQMTVLTTPAFSASTLLYFTTPMPQQFMMVISLGSLAWLAYAHNTKKYVWCVLATLLAVAGYVYHELAIIVALGIFVGVLAYALYWRRNFLRYLRYQPAVLALLVLLLITNTEYIVALWHFTRFWFYRIIILGSPALNFLFPAQYVNIDSNQVGWPGGGGVLKYYLYYIGPPVIFLITLYLWHAGKQLVATWRRYFSPEPQKLQVPYLRPWKLLFSSPANLAALLVFIPFLVISEILPRLLNIALLPERAWIFGGFFAAFPLLAQDQLRSIKQRQLFWMCLLALTCISISGALYINWLKRYVNPAIQLQSAQWIVENLPESRRLLSSPQFANLLTFHAQSDVVPIKTQAVCSSDVGDKELMFNLITQAAVDEITRSEKLQYIKSIETIVLAAGDIPLEQVKAMEKEMVVRIEERTKSIRLEAHQRPIYFYFAATHKRNPYANRPYIVRRYGTDGCMREALNSHPELYRQVYSDHGEVIIWQFL